MSPQHNHQQLALLLKNDPSRGIAEAMAQYGLPVRTFAPPSWGRDTRKR